VVQIQFKAFLDYISPLAYPVDVSRPKKKIKDIGRSSESNWGGGQHRPLHEISARSA